MSDKRVVLTPDLFERSLFVPIQAPNTIFENVYKLVPGTILDFYFGEIKHISFWKSIEEFRAREDSFSGSYEDAKSELSRLLNYSISERLISDVPLGCFLSGGIDSTLVALFAQKQLTEPLKTFSIGFKEDNFNEAIYAKQIAEYLGCKHKELYIDESDMLKLIESLPYYYDEPFADPSMIPTMLVSKLAKSEVSVALSGDGGDEFFCGYSRYNRIRQLQLLRPVGAVLSKIIDFPFNIEDIIPDRVKKLLLNYDSRYKTQYDILYNSDVINRMFLEQCEPNLVSEVEYQNKNWVIEAMLFDQVSYLPGVLSKVDRASMKYSLEVRCPLLDHNLLEFSYSLPLHYKYTNGGGGKRILKDILYDNIPRSLIDRPKHGFCAPVTKWLKGPLKLKLLAYSEPSYIENQGVFCKEAISDLVSDFIFHDEKEEQLGEIIWRFFAFQLWYDYYCA